MSHKQKPGNPIKAVYTPEYRAEAVKLVEANGSITQAARNLGIPAKTLQGWVSAQRSASATGTTVEANKATANELARLRRENARLKQERDFSYGPSPGAGNLPVRFVSSTIFTKEIAIMYTK